MKEKLEQVKAELELVKFLIPPYPLISFKIQKYYQNEHKFNCVYSRYNLPKINDRAYVINLVIKVYMWMVIIGKHLLMQPDLTDLELSNIPK